MAEASTLLAGAWEISQELEILKRLAEVQSMDGLFDEAIESYQTILKLKPSPSLAQTARSEIKRIKSAPKPFEVDKLSRRARVGPQAREAFKLGMQLARRKQHKQALRYLRAALLLDPTLPGTYRILAVIYGKLGNPAKEQAFFLDYLRLRPDGLIADKVRKRLKPTRLLSEVNLTASFPCEIWINGRPLNKVTPVKGLLLPPGKHVISFHSTKYRTTRNKQIRLASAEKRGIDFKFGVLEIKLKPWARARANGQDLGLWSSVGLPYCNTRHPSSCEPMSYEISLVAHDNSRRKTENVTIKPGKTHTIDKW